MWFQSLSQEDPLEEEMATHPSILAWRTARDRGAYKVTIHRVAKSRTWLKWLSRYSYTWQKAKQKRQWKKINVLWVLSPLTPHETGSLDPVWGLCPAQCEPRPHPGPRSQSRCFYHFLIAEEIRGKSLDLVERLLNFKWSLLLLSSFSRVRFYVTPQMATHQAPPSLGVSRQEHWSGLPFPSPMHESEKWKWSRSAVSNSSRPHGLQPTGLLHPWDFPGKSTGVGCRCLLHYFSPSGFHIIDI